jgi:selenocysteine lyase/cysteine desulfurase
VPTSGGLVNPAAAIGRVARKAGVPYLLDACQAAGQMPLNVQEIGCDMLSATGRKFLRGPRGTGFLYVRREWADKLEPPFLDMRAATWTGPDSYDIRPDARRFETWESYVAGRIGLGVAVDYALGWGLDRIEARVTTLADDLRARLDAIAGVTVRDLGEKRCGIVTFTVEGLGADTVKQRLAEQGIHVLTSTASGTLLDMQTRGLSELVRASVHYYNTETEIDRLAEVVAALR